MALDNVAGIETMPTRKPVLNRPTVKALLALTKTRCIASDHVLRLPVSPRTVYRLNPKLSATRAVDISDIVGMIQHAPNDEKRRIRQVVKTHRSDLLGYFEQFEAIAQLS